VGGSVRFIFVALGVCAISIPAVAMPASWTAFSPTSAAVLVDDVESNFPSWRAKPVREPSVRLQECGPSGPYRHPDCPPPPVAQPKRAQKPAPAVKKNAKAPPLPVKKPAARTAARALNEQERAAQAPRPLIATALRTQPKAEPGKPPAEMALRARVGQLFIAGFKGKRPSDPGVASIATAFRDGRLSGVIVSDANISTLRQLRQLVLTITKDSADAFPIVAVEQPGGLDSMLSEEKGFAYYASASAVSSEREPYEAQLVYREMAAELSSLGVNLNIGPSGDICRDGGVDLSGSCFGIAPPRVAAFAAAFNFGHHDRGVLTALRHAPFSAGFLPSWTTERASVAMIRRLARTEPSDALVIRVKATETAAFALFQPGWAAKQGVSELRRAYGFHGAIIFDLDLGVGGVPLRYGEAILKAFQTGADIVMVKDGSVLPADLPSIGYEAVETGLKSGRLSEARVEDAHRHVRRLKDRLRGLQSRTRMAEIFGQ
jgi:beta-N-acetylhexosaminidase